MCWRRLTQVAAVLAAAFMLVVSLAPAVALAANQLTHGFLRYELEDKSVTIVDYAGDEEEVFVPAYIAGNPVNRIAMGAFYDSWTVRKVYLPDTVTDVDEGAFAEDQEVIMSWNEGRGYAEDPDKDTNGGSGKNASGGSDGNLSAAGKDGERGSTTSGAGIGALWPNGGFMGMSVPRGALVYGPSDAATATSSTPASNPLDAVGTALSPSVYWNSSAGTPATPNTAASTGMVDTNTASNAGTPIAGVVTTAPGSQRTPVTADSTSYVPPAVMVVAAFAMIALAVRRT